MRAKLGKISFREILTPILAVLFALLLGAVFILLAGENPLSAYRVLFEQSLIGRNSIATTLQRATPLIFTGLAVSFAFRCGLFNIGAEGQLYVGAFASAWVGFTFTNLPRLIHLPFAIIVGMIAGAIWGSIPGLLKAKLGVHEVINTIMLNFVAYYLTDFLVIGPFHGGRWSAETNRIDPSAALTRFMPPSRLNTGIFIAIAAVILVWFILWKTRIGYEIRAVGSNPDAAEYGGINVARNMVLAMAISGALAGLAGTEQILGLHGRFIQRFSPELGFMGIAVALLGKNHPVGVALAAILFGALTTGGAAMDRLTSVPRELIVIIQALIIFFVAAERMFSWFLQKRREA